MISNNILFVIDTSLVLKRLRSMFVREGYNVTVTRNVHDALKLMSEIDFDAIVLDIRKKGFNGTDAARKMKELIKSNNKLDIPIVLTSSYKGSHKDEKIRNIEEMFFRPFNISELLTHLKEFDRQNDIKFSMVQNLKEFRNVISLRRKVFVKREGYPPKSIVNDFDKDAIHILAKSNKKVVGTISLILDSDKGLPIEKKFDISAHRGGKIVEIDKLAVLPEKHGTAIAFDLTFMAYAIARFWGAQKIFIFTLKKKTGNILFYKKFGFRLIGEFDLFDSEPAVVMVMDFSSNDTYEKKLTSAQLMQIAKKLINRTVMKE